MELAQFSNPYLEQHSLFRALQTGYKGTGQLIVLPVIFSQEDIFPKSTETIYGLNFSLSEILPEKKYYFDEVDKKIKNSEYEISFLREKIGFNISQLSIILKVKRPAIYEWIKGIAPNRHNQERLDKIYHLFKDWKEENLRIGNYLYKKIEDNLSLYDLLMSEQILEVLCSEYISQIKKSLLLNQASFMKRDKLFKKYNFAPISKEQRNRAINRIIFKV